MSTKITVTDSVYVCLHEAGHAAATYAVGGSVEFIEMLFNHSKGVARTRAHLPHGSNQKIAVSGFAVEYLLFLNQRLLAEDGTLLSEKNFIDESMKNSNEDKISFFGSDEMQADGTWPIELDNYYMEFAISKMVPILKPMLGQIEGLAAILNAQGKVQKEQIEHFLGGLHNAI